MWNRHKLTARDFEGYGVYERDFGRSLGGSYELAHMDGTLGQLPDLGALDQVQVVNGLAHVPLNMKAAAKGALELLTFKVTETTHLGGVSGKASYVLGSFPTPWVDGLAATHVVMVQRSSVPSGSVNVVATFEPASVVMFVGNGQNSDWVIVEANPAALAAAEAYKASGVTTPPPGGGGGGLFPTIPGMPNPGDPCPAGTTGTAWPACVPQIPGVDIPAIPGTEQPPVTPVDPPEPGAGEKKPLPSWAIPVAVGAGVLLVGAAVFSKKRQRAPAAAMAANRGRYRAWG